MMKNTFYFVLKAVFVLNTFNFYQNFCSCRKTSLIRKITLISKFMTPQPGQQTITIHILPNISRSKSNPTMKFGNLIEYNKRNVYVQKLCQNMQRRLVLDLFFFF